MSKPQPTINDPQWQSGLPENLSVKTSDVLGYELDKDMNEDIEPKVKTVGNQSSVDRNQRKLEQQTNSVENERGGAFEHESHNFQKQRSYPSHFTDGEKSELEKRDDQATAELIHRPEENKVKTHDPKDDKNATSLPRKPVNDNKPHDEIKDSNEKEYSEKMNDRSAVENNSKKESDSDDSEKNFGQQKECSDESKIKNADIKRNPSDDNDQNKGFKEHESKTSANNKKEDDKDNQTFAGHVQKTGVDEDASKANNTKDAGFESKKSYTNRKASSPSPKEDTKNDDNLEKIQTALQKSDHQPKTQQKNDLASSSDDSNREIDSNNQKNDRKYSDETKSKNNENNQGFTENTGDTDDDLDPLKVSKNDDYDANNVSETSKNPKSASARQQQEDNRNHHDTEHKTQQKSHNDVKKEGDKEAQPKSPKSDSAKIVENPENETLADRVRDFGVDVDASKANTFGPKDLGFLKDDKNEDPNIITIKSSDSKNQKNESSIQDINESTGKDEDQNSIKQWIENLVTNDQPKSDNTSNDLLNDKKGREVQDKSSAEN